MSRILLAWELGLNLGHLGRLLPVAVRLKERGHAVLAAVRDVPAAASVFGPVGVSFVAAPYFPQGIALGRQPSGYADILLSQGWSDRNALWGLVHAWCNLFRLFQPDIVVLDYAPTARLAARIMGLPVVMIGNGFELPPTSAPLPAFPGYGPALQQQAEASEALALDSAGVVCAAYQVAPLAALRELFEVEACLLATFQELDHYSARGTGRYVGPLLGKMPCEKIEWPPGNGQRIFACVRPDTQNVDMILNALAANGAAVVCFAPGFKAERLAPFQERIRFSAKPLDLQYLTDADVCVSYGAEGTVAHFLLAGVPQLLAPHYVEAQAAAKRIEEWGAGLVLRGAQTVESVGICLNRLIADTHYKLRALAFSDQYRGFDAERGADAVTDVVEGVLLSCAGRRDMPNDSARSAI
ncbi:glycosyltransferase [Collimonas sp.]|jgi:UDP:flavonoid glycosyltransferase YjiC (YdhE family)|uniref:glycosyltransferase n=1 Tax=Collimonas sp. TaxID=1963772 RepID=UPI002BAE673F|nr:nucleotide disphospho-sugar-binding domain-containing protein [Collimonas sp.]HWW04225.1 nucleotide disphospho-sugar-binding domain-containing protein [Collimonas sp.]